MSTTFKTLVVVSGILLSSFAYVLGSWQVPAGSKANFTIDGLLGIDVKGTLDFKTSTIEFDAENPANSRMDVTLSVASIKTGIEKRDKHLKTDDFFDAAKFPEISFHSTSVQKIKDNNYEVKGNLKIKETTKAVAIPFTFAGSQNKGTFKGAFTINRMDYKVGEHEKTGVGKEVRIALEVPVIKK